jgi:dihydroorotate dehydrogenase
MASQPTDAPHALRSDQPWHDHLEPLIISAPFGNYVQPAGATPTLGTFTALRRPGRLWRIIKTVRYHRSLCAWTNKIGLRNPGIDWLVERAQRGKVSVAHAIVSIHGFNDAEWYTLLEKAASVRPLAIELNMSCPNVGHVNWPADLFTRASAVQAGGVGVIVKLPPVNFQAMASQAMEAGLGVFHCCNTLPVPAGGMSGKPLKPVALQCIGQLRRLAEARDGSADPLFVIGGGGITTPSDIDDYASVGASRFAVGTKAFNPTLLFADGPLRPLIEHAAKVVAALPGSAAGTRD